MYIIIAGCGRMGSTLARELANEGHDIAVIDSSAERLETLGSGFNGNRIVGIEYDSDILCMAGIEYSNVFLAMTPDDNINIAGAQIARDIYKVPRVIARISDPQKEFIYKKLNLETICPTQSSAYIVRSRIFDSGTRIIADLESDYELIEVVCANNAKRTVGWHESKFRCRMSGIVREEVLHLSDAEELVLEGDGLICLVQNHDKERFISFVTGEMM